MPSMSNSYPPIAIIGGSGLDAFEGLEKPTQHLPINTPFGQPSAGLVHGQLSGVEVVFLARHGENHQYAPHRVNYRANMHALSTLGVREVLAVAAVGGISAGMHNQALVVPDQLIDYTSGRLSSFSDRPDTPVQHVDFSYPFDHKLSQDILQAASGQNIVVQDGGVYGVTQGPRLETAAEISRMEKDGCDLVGMTLMPEAVLAREAGLH
ncbi:MAG TPA: S-methyl-5'-thioinosine phosphorylase, partial [Myxococcales bacterium]|nr:S-methyl-5'-thioinosine phosphorylase [Myxococcales bacterium]